MTSEQSFEIAQQPEATCPMIDAIIKKLNSVERQIKGFQRIDDADELKEIIDSIHSDLFCWNDLESDLEKVRKHVEKIRNWGEEWKRCAINLDEQMSVSRHTSVNNLGYQHKEQL